jgi:eukaryotic-like serine/threonine-protein kinase
MSWISDRAIDRLRDAAAWPELDDRYTITGIAGRGGMGTVYVANDRVLNREVAVKVLDVADRHGSRAARLTREAHILARLDHPGIVPVHDAGLLPDGRTFYVMKLVRGRRLDEVVTEATGGSSTSAQGASASASASADKSADKKDPPLHLFARVLDAVAFAHAHGIVHRDLKPENIMVGTFGEVFVMDWGVAQDGALDADAAVVGTPGFMPPEQERALDAVDGRADVYALGAILLQLVPSPPRALRAIAEKARHHDPAYRYQTVEGLAADLARFRDHEPVAAYRESPVERLVRVYRRYELPILLLMAYVVMRFVLLAWRGI